MGYEAIEYAGVFAVGVIIGLCQLLKGVGLNSKFIPIFAVLFGLAIGFATCGNDWLKGVMTGLATGLSSVGLYSSVKNVKEGI